MKTTVVVRERVVVAIVAAREARVDRMMEVRELARVRVVIVMVAREERARAPLMMDLLEKENLAIMTTKVVTEEVREVTIPTTEEMMMMIASYTRSPYLAT